MPVVWAAEGNYQLGQGFKLADWLTVGGYISTEYKKSDDHEEFVVDDLAFLAYGEFGDSSSFMLELESVDAFEFDFDRHESRTNLPPAIERLYFDHGFSDHISVRVGKQITPIGYWNLQPINVLRETTSNPRYSREMFPKFLTGVDIYGYTTFDDNLTYHIYMQSTGDLDDAYININIDIDKHYGFSANKQFSGGWEAGGSLGRFEKDGDFSTRYLQLNARRVTGAYTFVIEAISSLKKGPGQLADRRSNAAYIQGEYRYKPRHSIISRLEYRDDGNSTNRERIAILGYSFRPVYPVSLKLEYQWHTLSDDNQLQASFSVLF